MNITLDAPEVPEVRAVRSSPMEPALVSTLRSRNLVIADDPQDGEEQSPTISVLIRSDNYWRLVTGRIERFTNSMGAIETASGWVIQGAYTGKNHPLTSKKSSMNTLMATTMKGKRVGVSKRQRRKRMLISFSNLEPNSKVKPMIQQRRFHDADVRKPAEVRETQRQCLSRWYKAPLIKCVALPGGRRRWKAASTRWDSARRVIVGATRDCESKPEAFVASSY